MFVRQEASYVDVGIEHVLEVLGGDIWHLVDQIHQEASHTVICCHFTRLKQIEQGYSLKSSHTHKKEMTALTIHCSLHSPAHPRYMRAPSSACPVFWQRSLPPETGQRSGPWCGSESHVSSVKGPLWQTHGNNENNSTSMAKRKNRCTLTWKHFPCFTTSSVLTEHLNVCDCSLGVQLPHCINLFCIGDDSKSQCRRYCVFSTFSAIKVPLVIQVIDSLIDVFCEKKPFVLNLTAIPLKCSTVQRGEKTWICHFALSV